MTLTQMFHVTKVKYRSAVLLSTVSNSVQQTFHPQANRKPFIILEWEKLVNLIKMYVSAIV